MKDLTKVPYEIPFRTQYVCEESYRNEGYRTLEEGLSWTARSCGIASVRMVIDAIRHLRGLDDCPPQGEVLREGLALGAYKEGVGWIHQGLVNIAAKYSVVGVCRRGGTSADVCHELQAGNVCIVSVSPRFSGGTLREDGTPVPTGGHLVAVYGFYTDNGEITDILCHHSSCFPEYSWPEYTVERGRFDASFSGNYIVFDPKALD